MLNTSKSISILMASAALVACLSNPASAMDHVNDDQDPGCCAGLKKSAIDFGAKKLENVALTTVRYIAQNKVAEELEKQIQETTGFKGYAGGLVSKVLALPVEILTNTAISSATNLSGVTLENLRTGKSKLPPKIKVALKDSIDEALIPEMQKAKPSIKANIANFADKAASYISAGTYVGVSGLTYLVAGYQYAIPVLVVGALDVVADKAGYLKKGLKSMVGFDNMVDTAADRVIHTMDNFDSNSVLKLYNLDVTEADRKAAKAFDETVNTESTSYWATAKKIGSYFDLGVRTLGVILPVEESK